MSSATSIRSVPQTRLEPGLARCGAPRARRARRAPAGGRSRLH